MNSHFRLKHEIDKHQAWNVKTNKSEISNIKQSISLETWIWQASNLKLGLSNWRVSLKNGNFLLACHCRGVPFSTHSQGSEWYSRLGTDQGWEKFENWNVYAHVNAMVYLLCVLCMLWLFSVTCCLVRGHRRAGQACWCWQAGRRNHRGRDAWWVYHTICDAHWIHPLCANRSQLGLPTWLLLQLDGS